MSLVAGCSGWDGWRWLVGVSFLFVSLSCGILSYRARVHTPNLPPTVEKESVQAWSKGGSLLVQLRRRASFVRPSRNGWKSTAPNIYLVDWFSFSPLNNPPLIQKRIRIALRNPVKTFTTSRSKQNGRRINLM